MNLGLVKAHSEILVYEQLDLRPGLVKVHKRMLVYEKLDLNITLGSKQLYLNIEQVSENPILKPGQVHKKTARSGKGSSKNVGL